MVMGVHDVLQGCTAHLSQGCTQGGVQLLKLAHEDVVQLQGFSDGTASISTATSLASDVDFLQCYDVSVQFTQLFDDACRSTPGELMILN